MTNLEDKEKRRSRRNLVAKDNKFKSYSHHPKVAYSRNKKHPHQDK